MGAVDSCTTAPAVGLSEEWSDGLVELARTEASFQDTSDCLASRMATKSLVT